MARIVTQTIREDLETITSHSTADLESIVNSRVILTGASGFIGKWLTLSFLHARRHLCGEGKIILVCRNIDPLKRLLIDAGFDEGFEFIETDVRHFPDGVIEDGSLVIHAATPARASLNSENPLEMLDIIEQGQRQLLSRCATRESIRLLFLSSGAVYGQQPLDLIRIPETWRGAPDVTNPANAYHEGKRTAELMGFIYSASSNIEFVAARLFAFLAPFLPTDEHFAAGNFLGNVTNNQPIVIKSGGGSIRTFQYATDLCITLWGLLVRGESGHSYNVGSDEEINIRDLANKIAYVVNPKAEILIEGTDTTENVNRYVPDIEKSLKLLALPKPIALEESIRRTANWLKSQSRL